MTALEMIQEYRKGCSNGTDCIECATALIDALEKKLLSERTKYNVVGSYTYMCGSVETYFEREFDSLEEAEAFSKNPTSIEFEEYSLVSDVSDLDITIEVLK